MQGADTGSEPATSLKDSVVSGDVHTGNIIHNHYHITQSTPAPPVPQVVHLRPGFNSAHIFPSTLGK